VKSANAANPAAAARLKDLDSQLKNRAVTGRPEDADERGALTRERNELVKSTGVGLEGATTAIDETIKQTNTAIDKLKGTVDKEGSKIPPGLEGVQAALDASLKSFSDGLTKTTSAVDKGVPPVVEAVQALDGSLSAGLAGIGGSIRGLAANTDRRMSNLQTQIDALWRRA
jgi:hypothetical protein